MLGSIRKFSGSIYAKILLGIIIIPFVFWGMGSSFVGGSKNVVVVIEDEKYSIEQFGTYINRQVGRKVKASEVENLLSSFIGEKLIEKEIEYLGITLSDKSLSKLIILVPSGNLFAEVLKLDPGPILPYDTSYILSPVFLNLNWKILFLLGDPLTEFTDPYKLITPPLPIDPDKLALPIFVAPGPRKYILAQTKTPFCK